MTAEQLADEVAITITDLSAKVREAILAGNSHDAVEWAGALADGARAWRDLTEAGE